VITHFRIVLSVRIGRAMLSLCAMHKDIFMGLGTGKCHVDIRYKMGVFKRMLLQFSSHFLF